MNNILHVLNGDATLYGFEQTGLEGDIMVWREVLSQGPVATNVSTADFWNRRSEFICKTFDETPEHYHDGMIVHLERLNEPYQEINLWFEYDLHCQVNLLGAMMLLEQQTNLSAPAIYLICPTEFPGIENFGGMGELNGEQLEYLYDNNRVQLGEYDFALATQAWNLYVSNNADRLKAWLDETQFWGNLSPLKFAMQAHLKRLQTNANGLNYIHKKLLDIYKSGITNKHEIYITFWETEKIYGMGDKELDIYLNHLAQRGYII
ncbi:MAG: hypothetical protein JWP67_858 [Mucilaginibacter sp.]|nr:hypothetical protein [Mucilaginibacter sp.]